MIFRIRAVSDLLEPCEVKVSSPVLRGLRHDATEVFVVTGITTRTQPSVLPLVPYQDVRLE